MTRIGIACVACLWAINGATWAQETAKVQITVRVPANTASFKDQRLVVMLYHNHPSQEDRGLKAVDRYIDAMFSHEKGNDTVVTVTLGEKATLDRSRKYSVTANVFQGPVTVTYISEHDGMPGPFYVLTNDAPDRLTLFMRPAP